MRRAGRVALVLIVLLMALFAYVEISIFRGTRGLLYDDPDLVPANRVGLILGTAKYLPGKKINPYFYFRMLAARELFKRGKVSYLVVSGDNSSRYYNEPLQMKRELMAMGVPAERIVFDFAGFNTYDSVLRMKRVFRQSRFTVISQRFHNRRAIFIARKFGLQAIAYDARDIGFWRGMPVFWRERLARLKLFWDILVRRDPRFLGDPIEI